MMFHCPKCHRDHSPSTGCREFAQAIANLGARRPVPVRCAHLYGMDDIVWQMSAQWLGPAWPSLCAAMNENPVVAYIER